MRRSSERFVFDTPGRIQFVAGMYRLRDSLVVSYGVPTYVEDTTRQGLRFSQNGAGQSPPAPDLKALGCPKLQPASASLGPISPPLGPRWPATSGLSF